MLALLIVQASPPGFVPAQDLAVLRRDPNDPKAPDWVVAWGAKGLRVETSENAYAREKREAAAWKGRPGMVTIAMGMSKITLKPEEGVPVEGGWLHPIDNGEFAGGILWFAQGSQKPKTISHDNTPCIVRTPKGVFAVQALAHLQFWFSRLVELKHGPNGWTTRFVTDLHEAPADVVQDGNRFLLAMRSHVTTLETDGTQREIYRSRADQPFRTRSMVRTPSGEVWIGSSHGLLRLRPKAGGDYAAQWFLP